MKREIDAVVAQVIPRPCIAVVGGIKVEDSISIADNAKEGHCRRNLAHRRSSKPSDWAFGIDIGQEIMISW